MGEGGPPQYPYGFNLPPTQLVAGSAVPFNFPVSSAPPLYPAIPSMFPGAPTSFSAPLPNTGPNTFGGPHTIPTQFPGIPVQNVGAPVTNFYPQGGHTDFAPTQAHTSFPQSAPPQTNMGAPATNFYPQGGHTQFVPTQTHTSFPQSTPPQRATWVQWRRGQAIPANAVRGGFDVDKTDIYVGRLKHNADLLPAKVIPRKNVAYVPYNGKEISYDQCEILCHQNPCWASSSNGHVPSGAILVGRTGSGESLYAARVHHEGAMVVGKVHPSHGVCYIPFGGKEIGHKTYEVLIC